jgi:hypothetical protein
MQWMTWRDLTGPWTKGIAAGATPMYMMEELKTEIEVRP